MISKLLVAGSKILCSSACACERERSEMIPVTRKEWGMPVDLGMGQAPLYPVYKREKYKILVSCEEWGEETLYAARKGHVLLYPARKKTGTPGPSPEAGRESLYPVRKGDRNPCILWGRGTGIPVSCEEGGQESLYPVRKGNRNPCILWGRGTGFPVSWEEGGQESLYPVRKHRIGIPCFMWGKGTRAPVLYE
jgi:hypothetical protein